MSLGTVPGDTSMRNHVHILRDRARAAREHAPPIGAGRPYDRVDPARDHDRDDSRRVTESERRRGRVWIDLANTPHVLVFTPVVERLRREGWEVVLTARDHAQTLDLARVQWPDVSSIGGSSPPGRFRKAATLAARTRSVVSLLQAATPGCRALTWLLCTDRGGTGHWSPSCDDDGLRTPAGEPPQLSPGASGDRSGRLSRSGSSPLRRGGLEGRALSGVQGGALPRRVSAERQGDPRPRYPTRVGDRGAPNSSGRSARSPGAARSIDEILETSLGLAHVSTVLLPRDREQTQRYSRFPKIVIPQTAIDAPSLIARADLMIGGGGTMTRESALLGVPTYTVFAGALAAVDAELVRRGCLHDLRIPGSEPRFEKRMPRPRRQYLSSAPRRSFALCPRRWPMSQAELDLSPA